MGTFGASIWRSEIIPSAWRVFLRDKVSIGSCYENEGRRGMEQIVFEDEARIEVWLRWEEW